MNINNVQVLLFGYFKPNCIIWFWFLTVPRAYSWICAQGSHVMVRRGQYVVLGGQTRSARSLDKSGDLCIVFLAPNDQGISTWRSIVTARSFLTLSQ